MQLFAGGDGEKLGEGWGALWAKKHAETMGKPWENSWQAFVRDRTKNINSFRINTICKYLWIMKVVVYSGFLLSVEDTKEKKFPTEDIWRSSDVDLSIA